MNKLKTVTIGIPAYNESSNIRKLLLALKKQKEANFEIKKILVISDGSTDDTVSEIKRVPDSRIRLVDNKTRQGKTVALNYILKNANTDYLVLMDADVLPDNNQFIHNLVEGFHDQTVGLVCTKPIPVKEKTLFEKVINHSHRLKLIMNDQITLDNQVYLANGRSMGLSKKLYSRITLPVDVIADDAFIFFSCLKLKLKVRYSGSAIVRFRSPGNFSDHMKQSTRFHNSQQQLKKLFPAKKVLSQYSLDASFYTKTILVGFVESPILTLSYMLLLTYAKLMSSLDTKSTHLWSPAVSSKNI